MINNKLPINYKLFHFDEIESTMLTLKEMAFQGAEVGTIVCAKKQNQGRGRHGREWISPLGNLYFSYLRKAENKNSNSVFAPVFIVSIALAKAINLISKNKIIPMLKWPNDVLVNNSKLAGILIESFVDKDNRNLLNIGVGVNVSSHPSNTIYPATNLKNEGLEITSNELLICFFNCLNMVEDILVNKGLNEIFKIWQEYSYKIGTKMSVKIGNKKITGSYNGIDEKGSLILNINNKNIKILTGEIFVL